MGIIRLSGESALPFLQQISSKDPQNLPQFQPRFMRHGWVYIENEKGLREAVDEVLAVYMPGPRSFTGEDVAEIHCHGGPAVLSAVLHTLCGLGARIAEKGEFTYRAFLNGKYDLTQAEAIAEMIAAPARQGLRLAQAKLSGQLGKKIDELREVVEHLRASAVLAIDFPEESDVFSDKDFQQDLDGVRAELRDLLAKYQRARHWREGMAVTLAGMVNVGKSSLLNALLGHSRAIVSDIPGTTRDFIEESLNLDGLQVRITDTAGLRNTEDPVEMAGVGKARELFGNSRLILLVTDASRPLTDDERSFLDEHKEKILLVRNKLDLLDASSSSLEQEAAFAGLRTVGVSALSGQGLESLAQAIREEALSLAKAEAQDPEQGDLVPNLRQSELIRAALEEADALACDVAAGIACDLFSVRLDAMARHLAEITGFASPDDVLGKIFSSFCIGK